MITAIVNWWHTLIKEELELTVWFDGGTREDAEGNLTPNPKSKKVFHLKPRSIVFFFRNVNYGVTRKW